MLSYRIIPGTLREFHEWVIQGYKQQDVTYHHRIFARFDREFPDLSFKNTLICWLL
jgi:hypothetical protein